MATRRRRKTTRRRVRRVAANPIRRRRRTTVRRRRASVFSSRRRANPVARRRRRTTRRRRNPVISRASFSDALNLAGGAVGVGFVTPILTKYVGSYLPFSSYNGPVLTFGSGWVTSKLFEFLPMTRRFSNAAFLAGTAAAVIQLVSPIIRSVLGTSVPNAFSGMSGYPGRRGYNMRGIAAVPTNQPPGMAIPLPPPTANGMQGIGSYPTVGSFRR